MSPLNQVFHDLFRHVLSAYLCLVTNLVTKPAVRDLSASRDDRQRFTGVVGEAGVVTLARASIDNTTRTPHDVPRTASDGTP